MRCRGLTSPFHFFFEYVAAANSEEVPGDFGITYVSKKNQMGRLGMRWIWIDVTIDVVGHVEDMNKLIKTIHKLLGYHSLTLLYSLSF